jgi:hypothetical protein
VRWSSGDGEEIGCGEEYFRLCREDSREREVVDQRGERDEPRVMGRDVLRKVYGRCPGIAEDSTYHLRVD